MKALAKASRLNIAQQVIQYMDDGMTVVEACRAVAMPRSSFYYIVENNPEAIAEVQAIIEAHKREQLGLILLSKTELLLKVIEAGLTEETKPKDRLAIFMKLNELEDSLAKNMHIESEADREAYEFLSQGPKLVKAKSRFTATQTTISYERET